MGVKNDLSLKPDGGLTLEGKEYYPLEVGIVVGQRNSEKIRY